MAVTDDQRVGTGVSDRERIRGDIRLVIAIIAVLDVMVIAAAALLSERTRAAIDIFAPSLGDPLIAQATPWIIVGWCSPCSPRVPTQDDTSAPGPTSTGPWPPGR